MKNEKQNVLSGFKHMSIAKKITCLYGGIFSLSLLFISLFLTLNISIIQQHNIRQELTDTLNDISVWLLQDEPLTQEKLNELLGTRYVDVNVYSENDDTTYCTYNGDSPAMFGSPKVSVEDRDSVHVQDSGFDSLLNPKDEMKEGAEFLVAAQKNGAENTKEYILSNRAKQQFMLITKKVFTETNVYTLEAFKLIDVDSSFVRSFIGRIIICDLVGILCAFLIGHYISRRMLQPVEAIRAAAERITIEDLSQRIDTSGPDDEMKELTTTFNSMIDRLENSFQRQNQFVSDASHELRTPISVIQGYANLMNRWGKSDPEILQESLDSILSETEHMSALIRKLLFLAKGDQNRTLTQKQSMFLNDTATELVKEMQILEVEPHVVLQVEDECRIWADPDLMKQLLWVYAENAIKYTPTDGTITVRVWKDKKYGYVSIRDTGTGMEQPDLEKIFDRFYRVDKSRNKGISGTGLGLSIAKWIMDCHEGTITVESEVGKGTTFTNRFTLYQPNKKELKK